MTLYERVQRAHGRSQWLIELAPRVAEMPAPIQKHDDPFLPYCRVVFGVTSDLVAGYVFDLAAFLALGAAGAVALERAVAVVAATPDTLAVIHGPFTRPEYTEFLGVNALRADAATVTDDAMVAAFAARGVTALKLLAAGDAGVDGLSLTEGVARWGGLTFRLARQRFLDQFQRDDFAAALRSAAEQEFKA